MTPGPCLAIDPGYARSALVAFDPPAVRSHAILSNADLLADLRARPVEHPLVIEEIESYGMAVGREVFGTVWWSGRFAEAWESRGGRVVMLPRRAVKLALCGQARAKDSNIRAALLDRFGPGRELAIGTRKAPGPLHGVTADRWSALALAVTFAEGATPARLTP